MLTNASLRYHYHPAKGWINDPNGLCFFRGEYHFFYQHAPGHEYPWAEPMVWGHCRTKDFLHYEELPVALRGDMPYDAGGVWSGTAAERDGCLFVFYASVDADGRQTISAAVSEDGVRFEKYAGNPILRTIPGDGSRDFRDPAILMDPELGDFLVVASGDVKRGTGNLLLYRGDGRYCWEYVGVLYEYPGCRYCECPSFVRTERGWMLSVSVVRQDGSHDFEVLEGAFDGRRFTPQVKSRFQKGPDEYAGQIFHAPDGRNILVSWIPGWEYQPKEKCIGCLSIPLEVRREGDRLTAYPVEELRHLVGEGDAIVDGYIRERYPERGREVRIELLQKPEERK